MSLLIKGMEMPSSCGFCVMLDEDDKNFCYAEMRETTIGADRPEWCPLVELTEAVFVKGGVHFCEVIE